MQTTATERVTEFKGAEFAITHRAAFPKELVERNQIP
jgi:hypothetical protein